MHTLMYINRPPKFYECKYAQLDSCPLRLLPWKKWRQHFSMGSDDKQQAHGVEADYNHSREPEVKWLPVDHEPIHHHHYWS